MIGQDGRWEGEVRQVTRSHRQSLEANFGFGFFPDGNGEPLSGLQWQVPWRAFLKDLQASCMNRV